MENITLQNVVLPENCVKFYTSSPIDNGIETKIPISLMQYDSGMAVVAFTILEKNTVYIPKEGTLINVRFEKPDGHGVYNPCIGFDENGTVYFTITEQMTAASGSGACCLELKTDDGLKYTKNVPVYISKNPVDNENIESTDEYKTIFEIYEEVKRIGAIVENNEEAIQEIHDNIDLIKQVPSLAQQTQENANQVASDKQEVLTAKESVDSSLEQVLQSEQNAKQSEQNAKQSETIATQSAQQTQQDAQTTASDREYVESVMPDIEKADDYAIESKSWAVGGTGSREGEDVNNSKYWAEQAMAVSNGYLGYFDTPDLLQQAHPSGEKGDWAIVGETNSIWMWNSSENKFVDTSKSVDLSDYATKAEVDQKLEDYATKAEVDQKLEDYATKAEVDQKLVQTFVISVPTSGWSGIEENFSQSFACTGCTPTSKIISINMNVDNGTAITQNDIDNFSTLFEYAETDTNKITLYANEVPSTGMDIFCSVVL